AKEWLPESAIVWSGAPPKRRRMGAGVVNAAPLTDADTDAPPRSPTTVLAAMTGTGGGGGGGDTCGGPTTTPTDRTSGDSTGDAGSSADSLESVDCLRGMHPLERSASTTVVPEAAVAAAAPTAARATVSRRRPPLPHGRPRPRLEQLSPLPPRPVGGFCSSPTTLRAAAAAANSWVPPPSVAAAVSSPPGCPRSIRRRLAVSGRSGSGSVAEAALAAARVAGLDRLWAAHRLWSAERLTADSAAAGLRRRAHPSGAANAAAAAMCARRMAAQQWAAAAAAQASARAAAAAEKPAIVRPPPRAAAGLFGSLPAPALTRIMQHLLRSLGADDAPPELLRGCLPEEPTEADERRAPPAVPVVPVGPIPKKRPRRGGSSGLAAAALPAFGAGVMPAPPLAPNAPGSSVGDASTTSPLRSSSSGGVDLSLAVTVDAPLWAAAAPVLSTCRLLRAALLSAVAVVDVDVPALGGLSPDDCAPPAGAVRHALTTLRGSLVPALSRCPHLTAVRLALPYGWAAAASEANGVIGGGVGGSCSGLAAAAAAAADGVAAIVYAARATLRAVALEAHVLPPRVVHALRRVVTLAHLDVTEVDVADNAGALAELCSVHGRSLRHLGVMRHDGRVVREVATVTAALGRCEALSSVRFGCGVSAAVLGGLSPKVGVSLVRVEFGSPVVDAEALLAALPGVAPRLVHLSVVGVAGVGVATLAAAVARLPRLISLVTPLCLAPGEGAAALGAALANVRAAPSGAGEVARRVGLRELVVCSPVDDNGLAAVAAVRGLERLTLDDASRVTPRGVGVLAAAPDLRRLIVKEMGTAAPTAAPQQPPPVLPPPPPPPPLAQLTHLEVEDVAAPAAAGLLRGATGLRHVRLCRCGVIGAGSSVREGGGGGRSPSSAPPMPPPTVSTPAAAGGPSVVSALAALPGLVSAAVEFCAPHAEASAEVVAWRWARRDVRITVVADA
ncbi:hypothetical protein MMPV_007335, partial [Pyropia vietnamensis]